MKITFIHHSCFAVELEKHILVFDYFTGNRMADHSFGGVLPEFDKEKPLYFFASHKHADHFDMDILKLAERYPKIHYVLSKDIRLGETYLLRHGIPRSIREHITFVAPKQEYEIDGLKIRTLPSTDAGVAFVVKLEGKTIYHAGDLHDWRFEGDEGPYHEKMKRDYQEAVRLLLDEHLDVAFVVLDARLGKYMNFGMDYFMEQVRADVVFPMHMWRDYRPIAVYKSACANREMEERIMDISAENQVFEFV